MRFEKQSSQARNFKKFCKHKAYGTRNFNQWNWKQLILHGPNDHSILTHDIATCWTRFATLLVQQVATCCVLLVQVWKWPKLSQQHWTLCNRVAKRAQQVAPNNVSIWLKVNKGKSLLFIWSFWLKAEIKFNLLMLSDYMVCIVTFIENFYSPFFFNLKLCFCFL